MGCRNLNRFLFIIFPKFKMLLFRQLLVIAQDIFSSHNVVDYLFYADLEVKGHTGKKNEKKKKKIAVY